MPVPKPFLADCARSVSATPNSHQLLVGGRYDLANGRPLHIVATLIIGSARSDLNRTVQDGGL